MILLTHLTLRTDADTLPGWPHRPRRAPTSLLALVAALALATAACGGDDDDGGMAEPSPAEDACEHMQDGPAEVATAIADMTADAPDIGEHHTRWDVTLSDDGDGNYSGYVDLVVDEEGESQVFLSADVPFTLWDANGDQVQAEESLTSVSECAEVSAAHHFDLEVGTYLASFGPASADEVQIVVVLAGEHDHDDE